jgi:hypothetical protein
VPVVWDVLDVVLAGRVVGVVDRAVVVVADVVEVVDEPESDGLLEQAASARAQAGRISNTRTDQGGRVLGIDAAYDGVCATRGFFQDRCVELRMARQERAGAVPITEARSMERR